MHSWSRELSGSLNEIAATAEWVDQIAVEQRLPSDKAYALRLCAEELLTNIFRHGGADAPRIRIDITLSSDRIALVVEDDGKPFDVSAAVPSPVIHTLEQARPGGFGIQLIRSFADRLIYERAGLGNRVVAEIELLPKSQLH